MTYRIRKVTRCPECRLLYERWRHFDRSVKCVGADIESLCAEIDLRHVAWGKLAAHVRQCPAATMGYECACGRLFAHPQGRTLHQRRCKQHWVATALDRMALRVLF